MSDKDAVQPEGCDYGEDANEGESKGKRTKELRTEMTTERDRDHGQRADARALVQERPDAVRGQDSAVVPHASAASIVLT